MALDTDIRRGRELQNTMRLEGGRWFFLREGGATRYGPYNNEEEAQENCERYIRSLTTGVVDPDFRDRIGRQT